MKNPAVVLDVNGKELMQVGNNPASWARFSPDGTSIATTENGLTRIWDANTGVSLLTYAGHSDRVWTVEFSQDGIYVVTASADGTARLFPASFEALASELASILK